MAYEIRFKPCAVKELARLPKADARRVLRRIRALANDPVPSGAKKLTGLKNLYRIRSRDYRVVYQIRKRALLVLVLRVRHRRDIYRGL